MEEQLVVATALALHILVKPLVLEVAQVEQAVMQVALVVLVVLVVI